MGRELAGDPGQQAATAQLGHLKRQAPEAAPLAEWSLGALCGVQLWAETHRQTTLLGRVRRGALAGSDRSSTNPREQGQRGIVFIKLEATGPCVTGPP